MNPEQNWGILQKIDTSALDLGANLDCCYDLAKAYLANQLSGIKKQDDDPLTIFNRDIDERIIDTAFEKLADPETNKDALDLLCAIFDIYAAQAATADQSLKGQGDKTSTKPEFSTFLTFSENLGGIFSADSKVPSSELPRMAEQATELLMHLVNIFPPNIVEYAGDVFEETSNFLIENAPNYENALNLLEKIILSELHVFGKNFKAQTETKSKIEKDFENLRNYSSNAEEAQEAWENIKNRIEQIGNHIAGQSGETIQNYQERLQSIYETGQDPHMRHFLVQLNKKMQWPSVTDLTNILKNEYQKFKDQGILYTLVEMYESSQNQGARENIRNFLIEQYIALDKEENVLAPDVLGLLQQMYTSNPQDQVLHEFLEAREALPTAGESPISSQLTTLVDDSEEEDQGESLGIGNRNSDSIVQQQIAKTAGAQNFLDDENGPANIPSLEMQEQPKVKYPHHRDHHRPEQPQKQQSFWGGIGEAAGAAWNATARLIDFFDPNVNKKKQVQHHPQKIQSHLQKDFIQTTLGKAIKECGGGGHCLVLSVLRQINPQGFNNAYNQKGGRFAMAAEFRKNLANWAEQNITSQGRQPTLDEQEAICLLRDGDGKDLDVGSNIGSWIAQFVSRPIIVFSDDGRTAPGIVTYIHEDNGDREIIDFSEIATTAQNAILLYYSGNGEDGHYQAII